MADDLAFDRSRVLLLLVPALTHRLNNLLAVVSGRLDLWAARGEGGARFREHVEQASSAAAEATRLLHALSLFAGRHPPEREELCPAGVLAPVEALAAPLAKEAGVALEVETRGGDAELSADLRLCVGALAVTLVDAIESIRSAPPPRRARLVASVARGERARAAFLVAISAGAPAAGAGAGGGPGAALKALARAAGSRARRRALGRAVASRLALPARPAALEPAHAASPRREAGRLRVLLVVPDELLRDLVASVLLEEGYRVDAVPDPGAAAPLARDLVLIDAEALEPERVRALLARARRALVLGAPPPGARAASLEKPFGPDALLDAVRALAASDP